MPHQKQQSRQDGAAKLNLVDIGERLSRLKAFFTAFIHIPTKSCFNEEILCLAK
jgi:hypothetical protein